MFQTRCSRGVELLSFQKLLRKSRDSREKEGMYTEKHHRLHLVEETFWIKNCWKLHMRSTPKVHRLVLLLPLCSPGVWFWECDKRSLDAVQLLLHGFLQLLWPSHIPFFQFCSNSYSYYSGDNFS